MALGYSILGGAILGGVAPQPAAVESAGTPRLHGGHRLELRDPDGIRIAVLADAYAVDLTERVSQPATLSFTLPVGTWYEAQVTTPNHVALFDRRDRLLQIFEVANQEPAYGQERVIRFTCYDPLYLLADDSIHYANFEEGETPRTAIQTVRDILGLQTNDRRVSIGGMDAALAALTYEVSVEWETPLATLHRLRDVIGGYFFVDKDLRLHWRRTGDASAAREIRWRKNLIGFRPSVDNSGVITHLRYYGAKNGSEQVSLPDPGYIVSAHYEEGQRQRWHTEVDQEIQDEATLLEVALVYLSEFERPDLSAQVDILDLSQSPEYDFDTWYSVGLGEVITVHHPSLGDTPSTLTVVGRTVDLDNPLAVRLDLGALPVDVIRIIAEIRQSQYRRHRRGGSSSGIAGFALDPFEFAPPGTADAPSLGESDNIIRADARLPILPDLAGYTPAPITPGEGESGIGPYAAPEDHVHPFDPGAPDFVGPMLDNGWLNSVDLGGLGDALAEALDTDASLDLGVAFGNELAEHAAPEGPQPIVAEGDTKGVETNYARSDHTHIGMPWISVATEAELPTDQPDGVIGVVDSSVLSGDAAVYTYANSGWQLITVPIVLALPPIPTVGKREVFWSSAGAGTGDDQVWSAYAGQDRYRPTQFTSALSGIPVEE